MKVLVTGGAGYIGSVASERLLAAGHEVAVMDNLTRGHRSAVVAEARFAVGDVRDTDFVTNLLRDACIDCVMHFSASSLVGESMQSPGLYFDNNVVGMVRLLEAMRRAGVRRIIFSSSCATYGEPQRVPIDEGEPVRPTSPYGESKAISEQMLRWYRDAHGFRSIALRYFNAAGATARYGEDHAPETHLIPLALQAAAGQREFLPVFGRDYDTPDGTCIRDYIHVADLADAHIRALEGLEDLAESVFNLGNGEGASVLDVVRVVERVTGRRLPLKEMPRRGGDPARLVASAERAHRLLGWRPTHTDLEGIVADAWAWMQRFPQGYGD